MEITQITSEVFQWPRPGIWNANHFYGPGKLHKVTVYTDEGVVGVGWNGGTAAERPLELFPAYVDYFRPHLLGKNPIKTTPLMTEIVEKNIKILGPAGLHTQVLAAINIACWDIKGKVADTSVHQLIGGAQSRIRAYIAGGYYAEGKGLEELQDELRYNVNELHATAVKIKIGSPAVGFDEDMKRVEAAREAIGPNVTLLTDANCACDRKTATLFTQSLDEYDVYWYEEPLPIHDYEGHTLLSGLSNVKIATGENGYTLAHFQTLMDHNGASILNVDATICPGYDIAIEIAKTAKDRGLTIAPHGCQEIQLPLAAGFPHSEFLEYYPPEVDPLRGEIFLPQLVLDPDGSVTVPDRPGIGFELNMDLLNRYRVH